MMHLRPATIDDYMPIGRAAQDGELWKLFFTFVPHPSEVMDYIHSALSKRFSGHMLPWVVKDETTRELIGATRFHEILPTADRVEIGYTWYAARYQRTHVNTACKPTGLL